MLENFQWSPTRPDPAFACRAPSSWPLPRAGFPMLAPSTGWQHIALMHSFPTSELVCCSMSSSNYCFLTCMQVSQEAGKVVWYSHLLKNFPVCCDPHNQRLYLSQWSTRYFSGILLLFLWYSGCWQFDLWFFCLFKIQLEHLEVLSSHTIET